MFQLGNDTSGEVDTTANEAAASLRWVACQIHRGRGVGTKLPAATLWAVVLPLPLYRSPRRANRKQWGSENLNLFHSSCMQHFIVGLDKFWYLVGWGFNPFSLSSSQA